MAVLSLKSMWIVLSVVFAAAFISCSPNIDSNSSSNLKGTVEVDGSSTVGPVSEAVAEEFKKLHPKANVLVGVSGSGGGFKRFVIGETDISNASRAMKDSESKKASLNGIIYNEFRIGMDGLSVMVNPNNTFVNCLTTAELKLIWEPGSKVTNWNQVRSAFPDQKIRLYGPGTDSGTFDFFTHQINEKRGASRDDYTASEDDNILIQGIFGDNFSLGYLGYAYYAANKDKLKVIGIDSEDGNGCIIPGAKTIDSGEYPITRPLYIYVNKTSYDSKLAVKEFVRFYMQHAAELTAEVGYIPVKEEEYQANLDKLNE
jgi:phosphate transport system substrate-binding protein